MPSRPRRTSQPRKPPDAPEPDFEPQRNDPLASLRVWSVDVSVNGQRFSIDHQPASMWLLAILSDDMSSLLDHIDRRQFDDFVADGIDITEVFRDAIEAVSGRRWYVATRLAALWLDDQVRGEIMSRIDIATAPFAAVLDATYAIMVRYMDAEKRAKFENELTIEPGLVTDPRSQAQRARELSRERAQAIGKPSAATPPRTPQWPPKPRQDD